MLACAGVTGPSSRPRFATIWVASPAAVVLPGILAVVLLARHCDRRVLL
jgi:hypothetical protein